MKKILMVFICLTILSMPVFSATVYKSGTCYGLKDDNGNVILNAQYSAIEQLSYTPSKKVIIPMHAMDDNGVKKLKYYRIKKNNLWGLASASGRVVKECNYKNVEADSNGDIMFTLTDGSVKYEHPVMNISKSVRDTAVTVVGLPVTIIGALMIPIEAVTKAGNSK